jgi:hypothetical protein
MEFERLTITPIKSTARKPDGYKIRMHFLDRDGFSVIKERDCKPAPGDLEAMLIDVHERIIETVNGSNNKSNGAGISKDAPT